MKSNTEIILRMILLIALPISALGFLLGAVIPKQMGLEQELRNTLSVTIPLFATMTSFVACMFYVMKQLRQKGAGKQGSEDSETS